MNNSEIKIYKTKDGETEIKVKFEEDTVWLNLKQLTELFQRDKSVISRHINNIFREGELDKNSVIAKYATTGADGKIYNVAYYNLDAIISVGYRVNSKQGVKFRIWASKILKEYLMKGYAVNEKRLSKQSEELINLKNTVKILGNVLNYKELTNNESKALLQVISDYAYALDILDRYDYQTLKISNVTKKECYKITYKEAKKLINEVKIKYGNSELFGNEKDKSFDSSLSTIYQTFAGKDLYPSVEEKAANLLYFITKNHSFSDGNKRIAAFLFLYFLERNGILYNADKTKRINDNALVAITLMIAVSKQEEKNIMIKTIVNLINQNN